MRPDTLTAPSFTIVSGNVAMTVVHKPLELLMLSEIEQGD